MSFKCDAAQYNAASDEVRKSSKFNYDDKWTKAFLKVRSKCAKVCTYEARSKMKDGTICKALEESMKS